LTDQMVVLLSIW